ncbi:MAG: valine--tRNA ligase [Gemmatimonadetes bacterium]|nr:valine--tRNA ligase [Gemmatimonadota bacterium]
MAEPLAPQYDPRAVEAPLYRGWEKRGDFRADPGAVERGEREPYVIVIPPPNVTSVLHMGHGLNNTIQDVLIRWRRMQGREALWVPGTDHAGIATQNVVERQLAQEGKTRYDLGREAFVERVWDWVQETGSTILEQLRSIGSSCDWSRTRFTLEPELSRAVREVFVRLYEKGLVYRGNYIINWCPRCLTALSDEEAEPEETRGKLYYLRYPLVERTQQGEGGDGHGEADTRGQGVAGGRGVALSAEAEGEGEGAGTGTGTGAASVGDAVGQRLAALPRLADGREYLVVATTRPETMLGDTAVAVHPADERYRGVVGREVALPLTGRLIPVVADEAVDPEFGTGAVKVTPAHDPHDFELAQRHGLPALDVMTPEAAMGENAPPAFRGLDRTEARERVVQAFAAEGLLDRVEEYVHALPHCYRCETVVEPRLSEQWFVRMRPLAGPALEASRAGRVRLTPERWTRVYEHWLENIRDWCISRQLWWGHRIPVWYCQVEGCRETIVAREDPTQCPSCGGAELVQDPDVLDTWFSSWLWPFSTLGWPEQTRDLAAFYPTHTLSTAPEILFFWVARMIMAGLEFMGEVPFRDVYLHGTVRDTLGRKMSKSLGNGIDPLEVVQLYGADALRYTVIAAAGVGTDVYMNPEDLAETFATGRNFANKLWNAGRFALLNLEGEAVQAVADVAGSLELADRWILSRLAAAADEVTSALETFRFHEAAEVLYRFFWGELADWYLELVKPRFYGERPGLGTGTGAGSSEASREAAKATLVEVLDGVLRLLHPIMPFISEALWLRLPWPGGREREQSLVIAAWPAPRPERREEQAEREMGALIELIGVVRTLRSEYNIPAGRELEVRLSHVAPALQAALSAEERALRRLARVGAVVYSDGALADARGGAHAVLRSGAELFVPLAGVLDVERERARLGREAERVGGQLRAAESKLANPRFLSQAPENVILREREKAAHFRDQLDKLLRKLAALQ